MNKLTSTSHNNNFIIVNLILSTRHDDNMIASQLIVTVSVCECEYTQARVGCLLGNRSQSNWCPLTQISFGHLAIAQCYIIKPPPLSHIQQLSSEKISVSSVSVSKCCFHQFTNYIQSRLEIFFGRILTENLGTWTLFWGIVRLRQKVLLSSP